MAVFDFKSKTLQLKVVYYGGALGGKTTNLVTLHRLTDPESKQGLVSIATKKDRTLFFDLLPFDLGSVGGLSIRVKAYTVPGQVHYEVTRRQVLSGADAVVLVIDSSPEAQPTSAWALENLRLNLRHEGMDPETIPIIMQWNKRDLPDAMPLAKLETDLNAAKRPAFESVATTGAGVLETFAEAVKHALLSAMQRSGKAADETEVDAVLAKALGSDRPGLPPTQVEETDALFDRRFDAEAYRDEWAEKGRDRQIVDQGTLLAEAVQTGMELAEKLEDYNEAKRINERHRAMFEALSELSHALSKTDNMPLNQGLLKRLLAASERERGSLLLFQHGATTMKEREVIPAGSDLLNSVLDDTGSAAYRLARGDEPRYIDNLASEVFFNGLPPDARGLASCFIAPIVFAGGRFGALVVYVGIEERAFEPVEKSYWRALSVSLGLALHWRGLRAKLMGAAKANSGAPAS